MREDGFAFAFLGIFLVVLVLFFVMFFVFSSSGVDSSSRTVLWSALTMLVLLFGIIVISLFARRRGR
jgi:protein-S-isoprenylcysteine O-methyltransferase Ste14